MNIRKLSFIILIVCIFFGFFSNYVYATTSSELASEIYKLGQPYGMTEAEKVKIERLVKEFNVTDEQANSIMEKVKEAKSILDKDGISNLSVESQNKLKDIAIQTANIVDAKLVFLSNNSVEIYKDGIKIDSISIPMPTKSADGTVSSGAKLAYTGSNAYMFIIPIIALGFAGIVLNKNDEK